MTAQLKAAILLIGDELLSGKIRESNGYFLIRSLRALGTEVTELHMIPDQIPRIVEALGWVRSRNDFVLCCGGIGPTHDDRTLEAAAVAWNVPLELNPQMTTLLDTTHGPNAPQWQKLAMLPRGCDVVFHSGGDWPCYRMENVYFFPGSPPYVEAHFTGLRSRFVSSTRIYLATLNTTLPEGPIAHLMRDAETRFAPIQIGSYPTIDPTTPHRVRITIEARDPTLVQSTLTWLTEQIGHANITRITHTAPPDTF